MICSTKTCVPWWRTTFDHNESAAVVKAITEEHISQGVVVADLERQLAAYLGVPYVVLTTSGSMAILMGLLASGIGPGDEVIVPSKTWIATAHAPLLLGAVVKLVDVEVGRPIMDTGLVEQAITAQTKAIIPVHLGGRSVNMRLINQIASQYKLMVIEDAAQALGSRNVDGFLGTQSDMGCFSLSLAKIISTGQGGFVVTKNNKIHEKLVKMRTHGIGNVINVVEWEQPGFNFRFTDVLAAIGIEQLKLLPGRIEKVKAIYQMYEEGILELPYIKLVPVNLDEGEVPIYVEALSEYQEELIRFLSRQNIQCRPSYPSLHHAHYFNDSHFKQFPHSEFFGKKGMYLPSGPEQDISSIKRVIQAIREFGRRI